MGQKVPLRTSVSAHFQHIPPYIRLDVCVITAEHTRHLCGCFIFRVPAKIRREIAKMELTPAHMCEEIILLVSNNVHISLQFVPSVFYPQVSFFAQIWLVSPNLAGPL